MTGTWLSGWATGDIVTAAEFKKGVGAIFDSTLGGSAATIDLASIPATYGHLLVTLYARSDTAAATTNTQLRFNNDSAANYDIEIIIAAAASVTSGESFAATSAQCGVMPANTAGANLFSANEIFIPNYAGAANNKHFVALNSYKTGTATTNLAVNILGGAWRSNAAINRITLLPLAGSFVTGTRCTIYAMGA